MYNINWIVLRKKQIKELSNLVTLFSRDFWKISAFIKESKTKNGVDVWNIYNFAIKTDKNINKIESFKPKKILKYENLDYNNIESLLDLTNVMFKILPENMVFESIFDDYFDIFENFSRNNLSEKSSILLKLKILKKIWVSQEPIDVSIDCKKIYSIIDKYSTEKILQIKWLQDITFDEIKKYTKITFENYLF